jgi:uncharacterized membrane protein YhhN
MKTPRFPTRFVLSLLVLLLALALRGWRLERWTGFGYDQERDAFLIRSILKDRRLMLIGAKSAPTGLYTGSLYLYLMAPFYWLFRFDPLGGAVFAVLAGALTTALLIWSGSKLVNFRVGVIAALLYATSLAMINYDRTPWNPTLLMATSLVLVTSLIMASRAAPASRWWVMAGLALGFSFHLHFAAFYLAFFTLMVWLAARPRLHRNALLGIFAFLFLISPLVLFDFRHDFLLVRQLEGLLRSGSGGPASFALRFFDSGRVALEAILYVWIPKRPIGLLALVPLTAGLVFPRRKDLPLFSVGLAATAVAATALTRTRVVPYYFMPLFPLTYLLIASAFDRLFRAGRGRLLLALGLLSLSIGVNLKAMRSRTPSLSLWAKKQAVKLILDRRDGRPFRLSVTADPGRDFGFDYLFVKEGVAAPRGGGGSVYTIVVPNGAYGIEGDIVYDGVGVVFPSHEG